MFQMLRGVKTTLYLTDLMRRVGAIDASFTVRKNGETVVMYTLQNRMTKQQVLPRSSKLIDDRKESHGNEQH